MLFLAFIIRFLVLALACSLAVSFACLVEGTSPSLSSLFLRSITPAALGATAWTLAQWRHEGGVIALASGARSPWPILLFFLCIAGPLTTLPSWSEISAQSVLEIAPSKVTAGYKNPTQFTWSNGRVTSQHQGITTQGPQFAAPTGHSKTTRLLGHYWLAAAQIVICFLLIVWLTLSTMVSSGTVLGCTGLAIGLCEFLSRIANST